MQNPANEEEKLEFLRKILKTYTPSGNESKLSGFYRDYLDEYGFQTEISKMGNIIGSKGQGKPVILLSSHLDTVPPEIPFLEDDENIYARGAVDCKSAWASMLYSAATFDWESLLEAEDRQCTIILLGVVEEETSTKGMEEFFQSKYEPDYIIFGEPTKNNRICHAYRGRLWFTIEVESEQGHSSSSWNFLNPINPVLKFWNKLSDLGEIYEKPIKNDIEKSHFNEITITMTSIHAGNIGNSTPSDCKMDVDIRFGPKNKIEDIIHRIEEIKKQVEDSYSTTLNIEYHSQIPGVVIDPKTPLINALRWSIFKTTGKKAKLLKKTGTTFMNIIYDHYKKPTIVYGPGDPKLEHTADEFISKKEYLQSIDIYQRFFKKFLSILRK